jgi:deoxyribodipyrimidine photo-lyase
VIRIRDANDAPIRGDGKYVVYWMIAARRLERNFGLDLALQHCRNLKKPLVIFEALRCNYAWASDRIHGFVLDGMAENAATAQQHSILYHGFVEPWPGAGKGLLEAIAADACVVVTDEFPCFFLPHMVAAATKLAVRLQAVDSNGLLPLRAAEKEFPTAFSFRRFLQKSLPAHLAQFPQANPLAKVGLARHAQLAKNITSRWSSFSAKFGGANADAFAKLLIDHSVPLCEGRGGHRVARKTAASFP